jgi:hypothetical protein
MCWWLYLLSLSIKFSSCSGEKETLWNKQIKYKYEHATKSQKHTCEHGSQVQLNLASYPDKCCLLSPIRGGPLKLSLGLTVEQRIAAKIFPITLARNNRKKNAIPKLFIYLFIKKKEWLPMKCYLCPRGAVLGVVRERERERLEQNSYDLKFYVLIKLICIHQI